MARAAKLIARTMAAGHMSTGSRALSHAGVHTPASYSTSTRTRTLKTGFASVDRLPRMSHFRVSSITFPILPGFRLWSNLLGTLAAVFVDRKRSQISHRFARGCAQSYKPCVYVAVDPDAFFAVVSRHYDLSVPHRGAIVKRKTGIIFGELSRTFPASGPRPVHRFPAC